MCSRAEVLKILDDAALIVEMFGLGKRDERVDADHKIMADNWMVGYMKIRNNLFCLDGLRGKG